jgi:hypothetical protein
MQDGEWQQKAKGGCRTFEQQRVLGVEQGKIRARSHLDCLKNLWQTEQQAQHSAAATLQPTCRSNAAADADASASAAPRECGAWALPIETTPWLLENGHELDKCEPDASVIMMNQKKLVGPEQWLFVQVQVACSRAEENVANVEAQKDTWCGTLYLRERW